MAFDGFGRIVSLKDPNLNESTTGKNTYEYTYNERGLLAEERNALGNVTKYQYNSSMLLYEMTDSADEKTEYGYDGLNRLVTIKDGIGKITYAYDGNGNVTDVTESKSLLEKAFSTGENIHREYDSLNRVTKYTDAHGREVKYAYDELGNMVTLTYPGGETVRYAYNRDGSIASMESAAGGTFTYGYDNYGRLCKIIRPDGSIEEREYDTAGQLTSQTDSAGDGTILQQHKYIYDVFGELVTKETSDSADPGSLVTVSMTYDDDNRLKTYNGREVTYDAKGNMTYGPVDGKMQELTYDCRNRLIEAGGVSYEYDAENTRTATIEEGRRTEYVTDTGGSLSRMLTAYEADGTETSYYYGAEGLACQSNSGTGKYYAYHYDNIGSTTLITDRTGKPVEHFYYGTYGELLKDAITKIRFLYNGSYGVATDDNGLYYMRARYYNPDIKRFINRDIKVGDIGNSQSLNRYAYCEGNPVSLVDPFGLSPEKSWLGILFDTFKSQLTVHDVLGFLGMIPVAGFVFDLFDAGVYLYEGDPVKAGLSVVCAIPEVGDIVAVAKNGTKLAKTAKVVSNAIRTVQKTYVTAASASAALELAGDAKLEYAINGGQKTSSVKAKIGAAALFTGLAIVSGKSLAKDLSRFSKMADVHFKTTKLERAENTSGKTIQYGGVGGCFTAGTIVKTAEGDRNIEDIKTGDYVLAENPETGEQDYRKVVRTFIREKYTIIHVSVGNEEIETTEEHPFYVEGTGFVPAEGLEAGYIIRTADGRNLPIEKIEREELQKPVLVYNFEVEDFHTYYVSATGVLVHNKCVADKYTYVRKYQANGRLQDNLLFSKNLNRKKQINLTEWRRKIKKKM